MTNLEALNAEASEIKTLWQLHSWVVSYDGLFPRHIDDDNARISEKDFYDGIENDGDCAERYYAAEVTDAEWNRHTACYTISWQWLDPDLAEELLEKLTELRLEFPRREEYPDLVKKLTQKMGKLKIKNVEITRENPEVLTEDEIEADLKNAETIEDISLIVNSYAEDDEKEWIGKDGDITDAIDDTEGSWVFWDDRINENSNGHIQWYVKWKLAKKIEDNEWEDIDRDDFENLKVKNVTVELY